MPKVNEQTLTFFQNSYLGSTTPTKNQRKKFLQEENLEVFSKNIPKGQKVKKLFKHRKDFMVEIS